MSQEKANHQNAEGCCNHDHGHNDHEDHDHGHGDASVLKAYWAPAFSLVLLLSAITLDHFQIGFFEGYVRVGWYMISYIPVAFPVVRMAIKTIIIGDVFTEFLLMTLATAGALALGEYPEAVAVMLFYTVGELFQEAAVSNAKNNIKKLLDVRPTIATVERKGSYISVSPHTVQIGEIIQVKAGEKVPLDGTLQAESASFNTAALTGESKPQIFRQKETILAGMVSLDQVVTILVSKNFEDSALSRILELVQSATSRKAKTELFIRKSAKIYTPIVFFLAVSLVLIPYFFDANYQFNAWLYRSLVFLVISCPCALVISIPLGYFGGIGAASRNGILFKGSNFLDLITRLNTVVLDKTGTLTHGVFKIVDSKTEIEKEVFIRYLASIESKSTHPIAKAINNYAGKSKLLPVNNVKEVAGYGLTAEVEGKQVVAGNLKLLKKLSIPYPASLDEIVETLVSVAIDGKFVGYVVIADEVKQGAKQAIKDMRANGIGQIVMLSGDKSSITTKLSSDLGIETAYGDLLPEDKVDHLTRLKSDKGKVIAFVGDGINDAPVLALSDIGIAMGAMGSDAAIETADIVIQNDDPKKIVTAIKIGKATKRVVYQNISLAFAVKAVVLVLGAGGLATMWEAVFADVGVAFLAILNAIRIQRMKFD